jgi:hypothetical protein
MDKFLDEFKQSKLNKEDINYIHRPITSNETEAVLTLSQKRKVQDPMESMLNSTRPLRKNLYQYSGYFSMTHKKFSCIWRLSNTFLNESE